MEITGSSAFEFVVYLRAFDGLPFILQYFLTLGAIVLLIFASMLPNLYLALNERNYFDSLSSDRRNFDNVESFTIIDPKSGEEKIINKSEIELIDYRRSALMIFLTLLVLPIWIPLSLNFVLPMSDDLIADGAPGFWYFVFMLVLALFGLPALAFAALEWVFSAFTSTIRWIERTLPWVGRKH